MIRLLQRAPRRLSHRAQWQTGSLLTLLETSSILKDEQERQETLCATEPTRLLVRDLKSLQEEKP